MCECGSSWRVWVVLSLVSNAQLLFLSVYLRASLLLINLQLHFNYFCFNGKRTLKDSRPINIAHAQTSSCSFLQESNNSSNNSVRLEMKFVPLFCFALGLLLHVASGSGSRPQTAPAPRRPDGKLPCCSYVTMVSSGGLASGPQSHILGTAASLSLFYNRTWIWQLWSLKISRPTFFKLHKLFQSTVFEALDSEN